MTYSGSQYDDYVHQGQQDDYFDQDLAVARQEPKTKPVQDTQPLETYQHQGQQDDYFDQDLAIAGQEPKTTLTQDEQTLETYQHQGQQDDYFNQDLDSSHSSQASGINRPQE